MWRIQWAGWASRGVRVAQSAALTLEQAFDYDVFMSAAPSILEVADLARERAVAEFREHAAMKQYRDAEVARVDAMDASPMRKLIERSTIAVELAQAIGLSEGQVVQRLAMVDRVFEHVPRMWVAFRSGRVDAVRVREISWTIDMIRPGFSS